jgi:pimeloyl-ACP methyl ester carboxylesterase
MFATSPDGTRIAYDCAGDGPALVLLHGGFIQDRRSWAPYVDRLKSTYRVLAIDLRGHGESDHPKTVEAYAAARVCDDVLAVLDAEQILRTHLWGFSFGAGVALQFAVASGRARVDRLVLGGAALGRWLGDEAVARTVAGMALFAQAREAGTIGDLPLPEAQKEFARKADLAVTAAAFQAMATWPVIEPEALPCPALLYAGSENAAGRGMLETYGARLRSVGARWTVLEGLDHMGEHRDVERVLPLAAGFLRACGAGG